MKKKKILRLLCLGLAVWGAVKVFPGIFANLLFLWFNLKANFSSNSAYSVGIIGGADGPTAIFLTGPVWVYYVIPVLAIVVGVFGYLKLRKTK